MGNLIISASGVRGTIGSSLSPMEISRFATAFGTFIGSQTVVVGRDTRTSGEMVKGSLISGLIATGCCTIDVGVCPTPTVLLMSKKIRAEGSVVITASHNPVDWNGLKLAAKSGCLLSADAQRRFQEIYESEKVNLVSWDQLGSVETVDSAIDYHIAQILELDWIDLDEIRQRSLKVAIDACNGAGSIISPMLLRRLGCEVIEINCTPNGIFPRSSEPNPEALKELCQVTKSEGAHLGIAHDGDGDRVGVIDNKGNEIFSDKIGLLIARNLSAKHSGSKFVVDVKSTGLYAKDKILLQNNCETIYWKTGHSHIKRKVNSENALAGFEKSGHFFFNKPLGLGYDDALLSAIQVCKLLDKNSPKKISDLLDEIPKTYQSPTMAPYCSL